MNEKLYNNKPYNEDYINELREEYDFEFIQEPSVEIDGKVWQVSNWGGSIETLLQQPGRHYIYEPSLPNWIRGFIIE